MSGQKLTKEQPTPSTTRSQTPQLGSNTHTAAAARSLPFTQADLYNYLYKQNDVKPLSVEEIRKERGNSTDIYLCSICKKESPTPCTLHGAQHCKLKSSQAVATDALSTAIKSFPNEVQLCRSSIPGMRYGVITKCLIPRGTWLGPYEGSKVRPDGVRLGMDAPFMWEVFHGNQLAYFLDGSNEDTSSWMRFIACARSSSEQNLYAFQYSGNIYYRAFKEISPGTELLVWYDDNYPQFMGIPLEIRETEGIYQRAVDPSMKQDEVVVVVSAQEQPNIHLQRAPPTRPLPPDDDRPIPYSNISRSMVSSASNRVNIYSTAKSQSPAEGVSASDTRSALPMQQASYPVPLTRHPEPQTSDLLMRRQKSLASRSSVGSQGIRPAGPQNVQTQFKAGENNRLGESWQHAATSSPPPRIPTPTVPPRNYSRTESNTASEMQARKRTLSDSSEVASGSSHDQNESNERKESPSKENNAFKCGQCGKTFPQRSVLQIHVCPKQPYKPYHCGHCDRLFDDPNELRNHAIIHTNEKPFKCGYCSRSFSGATTLNNHIRTHTGEKPFECSVCGKTFSQASQLSRHEKIPGDCIE